ncbi:hypothetical protein I5M27_17530 [Adhaeribacter sp. BT258]|uniref:Lipoprotein n=1 Tax=Adhaeribacter terrigena TaxID=2793070 RepID=A0ABS1C6J4_9BACT|nr:hypothetical protein [Adhaeribacter terrigena]MBK0404797.1 hypothetical protein [Adhaeribacter terrigena]
MRINYLIIFFLLLSCENKRIDNLNTEITSSKKAKHSISSETDIEHIRENYYVGDINNDGEVDTATVIFDKNSKDEIVCDQVNCYVEIYFGRNIPEIKIDQSLGIVVQKVEDLNKDKANEIMLFSRTYEGWWEYISVWSFINGKWNNLGQTKAFITKDKDFENRIIKENGQFYLIGDEWNDDKGGVLERNLKVKIK